MWVCHRCFAYTVVPASWNYHLAVCKENPPGRKAYEVDNVSIWEVDGADNVRLPLSSPSISHWMFSLCIARTCVFLVDSSSRISTYFSTQQIVRISFGAVDFYARSSLCHTDLFYALHNRDDDGEDHHAGFFSKVDCNTCCVADNSLRTGEGQFRRLHPCVPGSVPAIPEAGLWEASP